MVSNTVMEEKKRSTIFAPPSVTNTARRLSQLRGDISKHVCAAIAYWATLDPAERETLFDRYEKAERNGLSGPRTVMETYQSGARQGKETAEAQVENLVEKELAPSPGASTKPARGRPPQGRLAS